MGDYGLHLYFTIGFFFLSMNFATVFTQTTQKNEETATEGDYIIPDTGFDCKGRSSGFYADTDPAVSCRVYHFCSLRQKKTSFACPPGTLFHQQFLICAHAREVNCSMAPHFYKVNDNVYAENAVTDRPRNTNAGGNSKQQRTTTKPRKVITTTVRPKQQQPVTLQTNNNRAFPEKESVNDPLFEVPNLNIPTPLTPQREQDFLPEDVNIPDLDTALRPDPFHSLTTIPSAKKQTFVQTTSKSKQTTFRSKINPSLTTQLTPAVTATVERVSDTPSPPLPELPPLPPEPYVPSSSASSETVLPKTFPTVSKTTTRFSSPIATLITPSRNPSVRTPPNRFQNPTVPGTAALRPTPARFAPGDSRWNFPLTSSAPVKDNVFSRTRPIGATSSQNTTFSPQISSENAFRNAQRSTFNSSFQNIFQELGTARGTSQEISFPRNSFQSQTNGRGRSQELANSRGFSQELANVQESSRELGSVRSTSRQLPQLGTSRGTSRDISPRIVPTSQENPDIRRIIVTAGLGVAGPGGSRGSRPSPPFRVTSSVVELPRIPPQQQFNNVRTQSVPNFPPITRPPASNSPPVTRSPVSNSPPVTRPRASNSPPVTRPPASHDFVDNNQLTLKFSNRTKYVDPKLPPNPNCPTCDPLFLDPGQCTPCVRIR